MFSKRLIMLAAVIFLHMGIYLESIAQKITDPKLKSVIKAATDFATMKSVEKLYVQTDKPYYMLGDTIRLKAYVFNADYFTASAKSGLLYIELDGEGGKMAKRLLFPIIEGLSWGDIPVDSAAIPKGNYTLRAYTNWMRNFGEDYIFKKNITVSQYENNPLLVKTAFKYDQDKTNAEMKFSLLDGRLQTFKDVDLRVTYGKKTLLKDKVITGIDGSARFNFSLPETSEKAALIIRASIQGSPELTVPVSLNRVEETDVQFMPEGGQLIAGIPATIGVKAISEDGRGINVRGEIINSKGVQIAQIKTRHKGMGRFTFKPMGGEIYTAKFDGIKKAYPLPSVMPSGTVLTVKSTNDSLNVTVCITKTNSEDRAYYLIAQARKVVCYAQAVRLDSLNSISLSIGKNIFPTGVVHISLLNNTYQPLNERIIFVNHQDQLSIDLATDMPQYGIRDSVSVKISVTDKEGEPVSGSFSIAVTDDSQIKSDSLGINILNNLLLTSDLKGEIEEPAYYFTENKEAELDDLMLTQGWIGYDWKDILYPKYPLPYKPETEYTVSGKVVNVFGKPAEKSPVVLLATKPSVIAKDTLTDAAGRFVFSDLFPVDTAIFKIQARNKRKKEFNVAIEMDEVKPPKFEHFIPLQPWYLDTDTSILRSIKVKIQENNAQSAYRGGGMRLKEVNIKAKKVVAGSKNLNGPGEADLILDEEEMKKADKKSLTDLLREKIKGFAENGLWRTCLGPKCKVIPYAYTVNFKRIHFIFDGINIDFFYNGGISRYNYIKSYLDYYTAEDVKGIEFMFNSKYADTYVPTGDQYGVDAYIEITTRGNQGPFMKVTPGTYLYKPLPFTLPKQFYRPKYNITNRNKGLGTDLRSTIHWEPNLITDVDGNATFSFYTADKPGKYTLIIEGSDLNGQIGYKSKRITISNK